MQLQQHRARLALPYTNLLEVFKPYMPFFTREDYFKFAYDNVNSPVYRHFWILLILFYENDYPIDQSNHYLRNFSSCEKRETCKERRNYSEGLPSYLQIPRFLYFMTAGILSMALFAHFLAVSFFKASILFCIKAEPNTRTYLS